ncbi:MAG: selenocysteine-specific translation elongation factor [Synergistaceae bacterium]
MEEIIKNKEEYPFVLGTAGHIDHGKTTLVKILSGVDCDRLSEEKKRGMTIELGFAPFTMPSGKVISIVDVPGHEKFIRQMVAGVAGIDAVMLVVAADDGVMPQTIEHLEILSLLGVKRGITVINKCDLVDDEMLELAKEDVRALLKGSFLENEPMVAVSATQNIGIDLLRETIQEMVTSAEQKVKLGKFFLPVDRVFKISGFGTVVTGTAITGTITVGEELEILPNSQVTKVRSLQVHSNNVERAFSGQRVAINLTNISVDDVNRGDVLTSKDYFLPTDCIGVKIKALASLKNPIEHWQRLRLHIGTSDVLARVSLFDNGKILPGETAIAQLILDEKITVSSESNFILRSYSPLKTIAGGKVLLANSVRPKSKEQKSKLINFFTSLPSREDMKEYITSIVNFYEFISAQSLKYILNDDLLSIRGILSSLEMKNEVCVIRTSEQYYISIGRLENMRKRIEDRLKKFHLEHPESNGLPVDELYNLIIVDDSKILKAILSIFVKYEWFNISNNRICLRDFKTFDLELFIKEVNLAIDFINSQGYSLPSIRELSNKLNFDESKTKRIISYMREQHMIDIISDGLIFSKKSQDDLLLILRNIEGEITLANVRDLTMSSRKYILPILEFFDSKGLTHRVGDKRILSNKSK